MLTCFNVQKTHYFSNTVHYCSSTMPLCFLQSPSFRQVYKCLIHSFIQVQSALIGQLIQSIVIGRTPQARVGNVTAVSIIASFSFQVSFTISSSRKGSRVAWQTQWWSSYVFAVYKPRLRWFLMGCTLHCDVTLFPSHTHTLTDYTLRAKLHIWTVNSKYLN